MSEEAYDERRVRWHMLAPIVAIVWAAIVSVMPPDKSRNPPPNPLEVFWWLRMLSAIGLAIFNGVILCDGRRRPILLSFKIALPVYVLSLAAAISVEISILHWVWEYPYPFGLPPSLVQEWIRHWP